MSVLEPEPMRVILFGLTSFRKAIKSFMFSGLKKNSAGPPRLNQL